MDVSAVAADRIEAVRQELARANISSSEQNQVQCLELLGEGTYGKVYKGLWKGSIVAVKTIVLPSAMSGQEKREKMAIMEAAISSALSHPNIMQVRRLPQLFCICFEFDIMQVGHVPELFAELMFCNLQCTPCCVVCCLRIEETVL
jgi:hypothetical protein